MLCSADASRLGGQSPGASMLEMERQTPVKATHCNAKSSNARK